MRCTTPPPAPLRRRLVGFPPLGFCAPHVGDVDGVPSIFWVLFGLVHKIGEQQITRAGQITQYKCKVYKLQKQESDFWYRAAHLANLFGRYLSGDVCETPNIKGKFSDNYSLYFDQKYKKAISEFYK